MRGARGRLPWSVYTTFIIQSSLEARSGDSIKRFCRCVRRGCVCIADDVIGDSRFYNRKQTIHFFLFQSHNNLQIGMNNVKMRMGMRYNHFMVGCTSVLTNY